MIFFSRSLVRNVFRGPHEDKDERLSNPSKFIFSLFLFFQLTSTKMHTVKGEIKVFDFIKKRGTKRNREREIEIEIEIDR